MRHQLLKLANHQALTEEEMREAIAYALHEEATEGEIAAFLIALKAKGETVEEIAALAGALRSHAIGTGVRIPGAMDNCGTGGDGAQSFNISTTAAFVLAGAGAIVAKHGNRSVSSKTGSADVLEQLGVSLDASPAEAERLLAAHGIAFLYAPRVHPKLKRVMKVRRDLRIPTIFNLIGPLTNPVALDSQLLGIYRCDLLEVMADVLRRLGRRRAVVLSGAGGMDEASLAGPNRLILLDGGRLTPLTVAPEDVGLSRAPMEDVRGGDAAENAAMLRAVLAGEPGARRDIVLLNAGIGLFASGRADTIGQGVHLAACSIDSGAAAAKLDALISCAQPRSGKAVV